jgi:hypothetical protein
MRAAKLLYLLTVIFLVGGLWAVILLGSTLRAPYDLSGVWTLGDRSMRISQSGRFLWLRNDREPERRLTFVGEELGSTGGWVEFADGSDTLRVEIPPSDAHSTTRPGVYRMTYRGISALVTHHRRDMEGTGY